MDDLRIIELYFERDEQAIKETDAKYGKLCHSIAYNILNNHEDSEECVNDTYVECGMQFRLQDRVILCSLSVRLRETCL